MLEAIILALMPLALSAGFANTDCRKPRVKAEAVKSKDVVKPSQKPACRRFRYMLM